MLKINVRGNVATFNGKWMCQNESVRLVLDSATALWRMGFEKDSQYHANPALSLATFIGETFNDVEIVELPIVRDEIAV